MECTHCGAGLEPDSKFCVRCARPVAGTPEASLGSAGDDSDEHDGEDGELDEGDDGEDDRDDERAGDEQREGPPEPALGAPAPEGAPGQAGKVIGLVLGLLVIVLGLVRLANRPSVQFEVIEPPDLGYGTGSGPAPVVPRDAPPERAPTETERALAGTWVATVGFDAPRPASMGATLVQIQALRAGLAEPTQRCIWLELYDNLRGFQHECGVVDGQPSVLQRTDPVTGRSSPLGVAFRWGFDGRLLSITYAEDMMVTANGRTTRFVQTALALPEGSPPFDVQQSFPEHPDVPPLAHRYEVFSGSYLGDEPPAE